MNIKKVTVIGVTGTMGANVTGIFASFGNAEVYCVGRDIEKVKATIPRIASSVKAGSIAARLIPADYSMLDECVSKSDLVFESVTENIDVKSEIAKQVSDSLRGDAISCTGTSGLSITSLAECYPEEQRTRFFGVHMFNPPYSLPLCEFMRTEYSDDSIAAELKSYLSDRLLRTVVEVKDAPAFLGNRIGFQMINEALQYAERYKDNGGIDYIDAILGSFTGRTMPPLTTSDFVGLDIHKAIVDNLRSNTSDYANDTFALPDYVQALISENKLGRKSGAGLYQTVKYSNGLKRRTVYDISTGIYRDIIPHAFPFANQMKKNIAEGDYTEAFRQLVSNRSLEAEICIGFLLRYMVYSLYCAKEVAFTCEAADDVMAAGFSWCPPLAMYKALSSVADVKSLIKERIPEIAEKVDMDELLKDLKPSKYDYRRYFKSGR
ncbi:MAG: 3-hydroxyacyl-CoA dehydrogenase family protein [Mogibacterium sp.]|nr:3-hydroxyacyl-CoA dehydrogenase family protein [Mogibacterium sp.]